MNDKLLSMMANDAKGNKVGDMLLIKTIIADQLHKKIAWQFMSIFQSSCKNVFDEALVVTKTHHITCF